MARLQLERFPLGAVHGKKPLELFAEGEALASRGLVLEGGADGVDLLRLERLQWTKVRAARGVGLGAARRADAAQRFG